MPGRSDALVVLTRPGGRNKPVAQALQQEGIESLCAPVLAIEPLAASDSLPMPFEFDLVVFVSGNAVTAYAQQLERQSHMADAWPEHTLVATVGTATAQAFLQAGFHTDNEVIKPAPTAAQDSESLWKELQPRLQGLQSVLIVRGQEGREWLGERLEAAGLRVKRHASYQRCSVDWPSEHVRRLRTAIRAQRRIICLLTSAHSVQSFVDNVVRHNLLDDCSSFHYVVIHPRVAGRLQSSLKAASAKVDELTYTLCQPTDAAMLEAVRSLAYL